MTHYRLTSDELADRLDATLPPNQDTIPAADDDTLVNLALQLARVPRPEMSSATFARIRAQVMGAHQQPQVRRPVRRLQMTPLMRWAAVLAITILFFGTAMIPVAASSLPGEFLYPVKLGLEQIEVVAAPSPAALSAVHLNHAERRLDEAQILLERGRIDSALLLEGWESLAKSLEIAEQTPSADIPFELQARAAQVDAALNTVLQQAEQTGIASPDEIRDLTANLPAVDVNTAASLAAPTATPMSSPQAETSTPLSSPIPATGLIAVDIPYTATVVATRSVNVRSGPGTNFDIIAVIQPGSLVEVIGQNDDESWLYARLDDDRAGWIAAFLLRRGNIPTLNSAGDQTNSGDFGCEHPGNYCNAPGYSNNNGGNGDNGQGPGNGNGNANGGGPPDNPGG